MQWSPEPSGRGADDTAGAVQEPSRRMEWAAIAVCAVAAVAPLWSANYLPMADLPQHAAQVSIWMHLDDPAWGFADQFELNPFTPYLLGYLLARAVATVTSIPVALKVVLSLYVVALPLSIRLLMARTGGDRWWALVGFPLAYGAAFYWGFFAFLVALPVGIAFVAEAWRHATAPTLPRGILLAIFGAALFACHALVFGAALVVAAGVLAAHGRGGRPLLACALPLAPPAALALAWFAWARATEPGLSQPITWSLGVHRLLELPGQLLGFPVLPHPTSREAFLGVAALVAAAAVTIGGLARDRRRWVPGVLAVALYGALPRIAFGAALVNERFAVLLLPFALVGAVPTSSRRRSFAGRALLVTVALGWSLLLVNRFREFGAEAAGFDAVLARIPPNRALLGLVFESTSEAAPGVPYLHFPAWYQAEKGGRLGYSFATLAPSLVRYRPGMAPIASRETLVWSPDTFDPVLEAPGFEYFLARDELDLRGSIFPFDPVPPELVAHDGLWWLYRRAGAAP